MSPQYFGVVFHLGKNTHYHGNIHTTNSTRFTEPRMPARHQCEAITHSATRHTSLQSSEVVAAAVVADSDAPEVVAAGTGACLSSSSSSHLQLLLLFRVCRDSV